MDSPSDASSPPALRVYQAPVAGARTGLRLLLIKFDQIGDFVSAMEAFRVLRQAFGGAEITLMCRPLVVPLAESTGFFDRVVGFEAKLDGLALDQAPLHEIDDQVKEFEQLIDGKYFLVADFHHDMNTRHWLDHVEAEYRAGFACKIRAGLDIVIPTMEWRVPVVLASAGHGPNQPVHAETRLTLLAHAIVETLFDHALDADSFQVEGDLVESPDYRALSTTEKLKIGIGIGAGAPLRKWPAAHWRALVERLAGDEDFLFVFMGDETDRAELRPLLEFLPDERCLDLTGDLPLSHVPAYLNMLDAYIGCDTGLTDLAAKLGVPTLNLFSGVSSPAVRRARGPKAKVIYADVSCAPCYKKLREDCPYANLCMTAISPAAVEEFLREMLAR